MSKDWNKFLSGIPRRIDSLHGQGCPDIYFRGHANAAWRLEPGLARHRRDNPLFSEDYTEERLYWSFRMRGAHFMPGNASGWTVLFYMQHFGLPTRLLDWSSSFASALYFAVNSNPSTTACIWILDPYHLNEQVCNSDDVKNISISHDVDYVEFMRLPEKPPGAIATEGDSAVERIRSQSGAFTLHADLDRSLDEICATALSKHELPPTALSSAKKYLELAGVDDFSIFPDLTGLASRIKKRELG